jgi:hypothetical protein
MKTGSKTQLLKKTVNKVLVIMTFLSLTLLYSCEKYGNDGRPGMAFLSVNWDVSKPTNLDVGTSDIPTYFDWGTYYRAYPGMNTLIYDGKLWKGTYWANYAWQVDYEIYENPGEHGGPGYNGRDGMNSYFDIVCTPYGPDITSYDALIKPNDPNDVGAVPVKITVTKTIGNYTIKITYTKVSPKHKSDESNVPVEQTSGSVK